jgi:S-adenosylmethionine:tRNA ribosyltransferase-isomerase
VALLSPFADSRRLWFAHFDLPGSVEDLLDTHGRAIRYSYVGRDWPLSAYQSVFSVEPGSAEMPSAARPFTTDVVTDLVRRGVTIAPLVLHTGVSSLEGNEAPYPERYRVPAATARLVNSTHGAGGRVVAIGTTVVRALETATDQSGTTHPGEGWTEEVITPERGVRAVDGLLTGWHEPEASHLLMLEAVAGRRPLELAYRAAYDEGYLWHEFGDSHLLLPDRPDGRHRPGEVAP